MPRAEPLRGEVWTVDFGIAAKVRPALVLSRPLTDDDRALIGVVPRTTALRGLGTLTDEQMALVEDGMRAWIGL